VGSGGRVGSAAAAPLGRGAGSQSADAAAARKVGDSLRSEHMLVSVCALCVCVCVCVCACVRVCVRVCVCERERETKACIRAYVYCSLSRSLSFLGAQAHTCTHVCTTWCLLADMSVVAVKKKPVLVVEV
jgi:hypothetical protein